MSRSVPILPSRLFTLRSLLAVVVLVVATVAYFGYLAYENAHVRAYLDGLRRTDPHRYLDDIRRTQGFPRYLDTLRRIEGYDSPRAEAPPFLVGRWSLKAAPVHVAPGTPLASCDDPIRFGDGALALGTAQGGEDRVPVRYSLADGALALVPDSGAPIPVRIVSHAGTIDYLRLAPPGSHQSYYAYYCSN